MTPIIKVLADFCAIYVDDIRLNDKAVDNPPLYFRQMYQYFRPAIANFTLPTQMQEYLIGTTKNPELVPPIYKDCVITLDQDENDTFTLNLGYEYSGFEMCSCHIQNIDKFGDIELEKVDITYDSIGTVEITPNHLLEKGTKLIFDFYTDGFFKKDLSFEIMDILGTCFELVWQTRFNNDWLSNVSKIDDRSFSEQNRANKENADTERIREIKERLAGKMRRFEQNIYYKDKARW